MSSTKAASICARLFAINAIAQITAELLIYRCGLFALVCTDVCLSVRRWLKLFHHLCSHRLKRHRIAWLLHVWVPFLIHILDALPKFTDFFSKRGGINIMSCTTIPCLWLWGSYVLELKACSLSLEAYGGVQKNGSAAFTESPNWVEWFHSLSDWYHNWGISNVFFVAKASSNS